MKIKGAIFDCDGTLVDSLGFWDIFYDEVSRAFLGNAPFSVDPEDDRAMRTQNVGFLARLMHEKYGIAESVQAMEDWCLAFDDRFYREVVELKTGARELLAALNQSGVKMCVASASEKHLVELVLKKHGILGFFEGVISCTEVGAGKDKPDVFLAAEKFLGTPHERTWVFEDSLLAIKTAKASGFRVAGIYDSHTFGQNEARELSDEYVDAGGSLSDLVPRLLERAE